MANCNNAELGAALGLDHSTVSRMRAGTRTGSVPVLRKLAALSGKPLEFVFDAADKAKAGDLTDWAAVLDLACTGPEPSDET